MNAWARLFFVSCLFGLLSGCGTGSPATSALAGNWLLVGPLPTNQLQIGGVGGFRLAMTFDVTGKNLAASGFINQPCSNQDSSPPILISSVSFTTLATGTIAADGSFTLQTPANFPGNSLLIQGKAPQTSGEWAGTYTESFTGTSLGPVCGGNFTGAITATSFPLVSGVYVGAGSAPTAAPGETGKPVSFQVSLHQGGMVTNPSTGISTPSSSVLTGSIQVGGSSCFSSGTIGSTPPGAVQGNLVNANFAMNDGSTLNLEGALTDSTEERIAPGFVVVTGGKCAGFYELPQIDRQN